LDYAFELKALRATRRCVAEVREIIARVNPHIVHSHLLPADLIAAMSVAGSGARHISHIRGTLPWLSSRGWKNRLRRKLYQYHFRRAETRFLAVSTGAADYACRCFSIPRSHVRVIRNGVAVEQFAAHSAKRSSSAKGRCVFGAAGRFCAEKGHQVLFRALAQLREENLDVQLRLAGAGGLDESYRQQVKQLGIERHVEFVGAVSDMGQFYAGIDALVLPSLHAEGLPRVLLEALAAGCAVIATEGPGISEVVEPGVHGLVVPPGDEGRLADAMRRLVLEPPARLAMADAGRTKVLEEFTADRVAREVLSFYRSCLAGPHEAGALSAAAPPVVERVAT
jgi:glycosyltransferase involved in cell wall biosynthesis